MAVIADITDQTGSMPAATQVLLEAVVAKSGAALFGGGEHGVTVLLVSDSEIAALHATWFNDPTPTDVITFPAHDASDMQDSSAGDHAYLGDIVLSLDTARAATEENGWPLGREVAFVLIHGLLHLAGWDDATTPERDAMLAEGERLLQRFERDSGTVWS